MAEKRDYYEVLGLDRSATEANISEAYRKLALECHPDRNPGDEEAVARFKEAAEAFEVLGNPEKRAVYDRYGHAGLERSGGGAPHFHDVSDIFDAFGDVFGDLFGGGSRRRVRRGADIRCEIIIDLLQAAHGTTASVSFKRHSRCKTCDGSGAAPGSKPETCTYCGGHGRVRQSAGFFSMTATCPSCHGSGAVIRKPCPDCQGKGFLPKRVTRQVTVPAGVDDQTQLRLQGEGEPNPNGGPPGDCYCSIRVKPHPLFQRHGRDIVCQVPLSYSQAALGASIEVPTLDGRAEVEIPSGTQTGDVFRLGGQGMPDPRFRGRGDLLVQVHIDVPKKLSPEHEELLRKLAELERADVTPARLGFVERLKQYFHVDASKES